ncbi:MAG: 50S ribosomal protein L11 methyltransferase [Blastocatellia bacterium]
MQPDASIKERIWNLVTLEVARDAEEFASVALFDLGTSGILTLEETDASVKLGAYFDEQADMETIARSIYAEFARAGLHSAIFSIAISGVPDQDWMQKWKEGFEPVEIGERLLIAPSWKLPRESRGRRVIQIDPGMAFGTGTHETTRMCLEAIEKRWRGGRLLDVGTGTGILAIAAAQLAPQSLITAIDIDPQAVMVARENIEINGVTGSIEIIEGQPGEYAGRHFDVVVANLTAEVIISLIDDLTGCLASTGVMILSGILTTFREDVERAIIESGMTVIEQCEAGEWSALVAQKDSV